MPTSTGRSIVVIARPGSGGKEAHPVHHDALPTLPPHEFLAAHLENIGMSATEWGKRIGIDRSTASRLLRGERKINTDHIRKTAEALHIDAALLI